MRNVELLEKTLQHIKDHPEEWDQSIYRSQTLPNGCSTACCFAGTAVLLAGISHTVVGSIPERAEQLLGLSLEEGYTLFASNNSLEMLELMVKDLVNGALLDRDPFIAQRRYAKIAHGEDYGHA